MEPDPKVTIQPLGNETSIEFPTEGLTTTASVTIVGQGLYRLESVPPMTELASYLDVIEANETDDGKLRFKSVVAKSGWRVFDFLLSQECVQSARLAKLQTLVDSRGAHWERMFGGAFWVCVPPGNDWDPTPDVLAG